jgi:hypothetical protein
MVIVYTIILDTKDHKLSPQFIILYPYDTQKTQMFPLERVKLLSFKTEI